MLIYLKIFLVGKFKIMTIKQYVNKFVLLRITFLILRYLITCINTVVGCFILSVLIDKIFPLPIMVFHIYWFVILAMLGLFFVNLIKRIIETLHQPTLRLQMLMLSNNLLPHSDDLINAYQLEEKLIQPQVLNFSEELATNFIKNIKEILSKVDFLKLSGCLNLLKVVPLNLVLLVVIFILYALPPYIIKPSIYKIVFTRKPEILGIFVSPKNVRIPLGEPCEIKVIVDKEYSMYIPELLIKTVTMKKFNKVNFEKTTDFIGRKIYKYKIPAVENVIVYRIKFRGISSKMYVIEPIVTPQVSFLDIKVTPPEYTGQKSFNIQSFSETKYLYGSNVQFKGKTNKVINEIYMNLYGGKVKLNIGNDGQTFNGNFTVTKNTELWFELFDTEGTRNEEIIKYKIEIIEDLPPKIQMVSPATDIIVEPNSTIPLVFSVKDDFGIKTVELVYEIEKKLGKVRKKVKDYTGVVTEDIDEYQFDLAKLKLDFGDIIRYYMVVYDNDLLHGYKYDVTNEYKIEIFSYEKRHQVIQQQIEKFIDKTAELLSKEIKFYDTLLTLNTSYTAGFEQLITESENRNSEYKNLELLLEDIISQMTVDPYTSVDTLMEFNGLKQSLQTLYNKLSPKRTQNLKTKDVPSAINTQEQIIDTLERASILTKDVIRRQNMENVNKLMKESLTTAKNLIETLQDLPESLSEEDKLKIMNLLSQIEDRLKKIQDKLAMAKKELPEEFVNRREIQNLDFVTPMDVIDNILELIKTGDVKSAVKLAEELLKQLDLLASSINTAVGECLNSGMSSLSSNMDEIVSKLDKIITVQQEIYQGSKEIDEVRISEIEKYQEKQLPVIEQKCQIINQSIDDINSFLDTTGDFQGKDIYRLNLNLLANKIKNLQDEIKNKRLVQSIKYIEESKSIWEQNVKLSSAVQQDFSMLFSSTIFVMQSLTEISDILQTEPKIIYPPKVDTKRIKLYNDQLSLYSEMDSFTVELKTLGRKSFIIDSGDITLAVSAQVEMKSSADALNKILIPEAVQHQNLALNLLLQLRNSFSSKQEQLQQISQQVGQSTAGSVQSRSIPGGKIGVLIAPVELPSVKDYRPPKEIREEIIKSLSERYPKDLQRVIEEYYKEVSR